jgi:hypothetical protein
MLKMHEELADFIDFRKLPEEDEYKFRKRMFLELYPKGRNEALEVLFCIGDCIELSEEHKDLVKELKGTFEVQEGKHTLLAFLDKFKEDPSKEYNKSYI